jgi:hypothetical protein
MNYSTIHSQSDAVMELVDLDMLEELVPLDESEDSTAALQASPTVNGHDALHKRI